MMAENGGCEFQLLPLKRKCGHRALRWRKLLNVAGLKSISENHTVKPINPTKEEDRWDGIVLSSHSYNIVCVVSSFHPTSFHIIPIRSLRML